MPRSGGHHPRTVLEELLWQCNYTYEELAGQFVRRAREAGENATITPRHLARLAHGERAGARPNPSTGRGLETMFGLPVDELLAPWVPGSGHPGSSLTTVAASGLAATQQGADVAALRVDEEGNVWAEVNRRTVLVGSLAAMLGVAGV